MHQDALLESTPVLLRRPHRDTGGSKTLAKLVCTRIPYAEAARRAQPQDRIVYASLIAAAIMSIFALSTLLFRWIAH